MAFLNISNVLGVVSLIVWGSSYPFTLISCAGNRSEGGIMALMALALSSVRQGFALVFSGDSDGLVWRDIVLWDLSTYLAAGHDAGV